MSEDLYADPMATAQALGDERLVAALHKVRHAAMELAGLAEQAALDDTPVEARRRRYRQKVQVAEARLTLALAEVERRFTAAFLTVRPDIAQRIAEIDEAIAEGRPAGRPFDPLELADDAAHQARRDPQ